MEHHNTPEYEAASNRVTSLIAEIEEQLQALNMADSTADVDAIIAEQEKSDFIAKQSAIIATYAVRDDADNRNTRISELEAQLKSARGQEDYYRTLWYKERERAKNLKAALNSLTAVLNTED